MVAAIVLPGCVGVGLTPNHHQQDTWTKRLRSHVAHQLLDPGGKEQLKRWLVWAWKEALGGASVPAKEERAMAAEANVASEQRFRLRPE